MDVLPVRDYIRAAAFMREACYALTMKEIGRNDPCPCGSGKKYKKCCMPGAESQGWGGHATDTAQVVRAGNSLQAALAHQRAGRLPQAVAIYRQILLDTPDDVDALHLMGMIAHESGDQDAALELISKAIAVAPEYAELHNNFGLVLMARQQLDDAAASYLRAIAINPGYAFAHNNLGAVYQNQGRLDDAMACYLTAIAIAPDYAVALNNLGGALQRVGRFAEAAGHYQRAITLNPEYIDAIYGLGTVLNSIDRPDEALTCFRRIAAIQPGHGVALHMIAALTGQPADSAPDAYVTNVFDSYADTFDTHLPEILRYQTPQQLVALIAQSANAEQKWDVLDLGCGTGLSGAAIAPFAKQLVGVDLSAKMLEKARAKNIYSRLVEADLLGMLQGEPAASCDLAISADVFVYVGRLDAVFAEVKRVLRDGGRFAFSIETLAPAESGEVNDLRLNPTGRFAHAPAYVGRLAAELGFRPLAMQPAELRLDKGVPVDGCLVLWEKAAG
jgi:predicted TPR repeat methyltransferase